MHTPTIDGQTQAPLRRPSALSRIGRAALLVGLVAGFPISGRGQPDGTVPMQQSVGYFAEHTGGVLASCNITFDAVIQDHAYRDGRPVVLSGSVGIMAIGGKVGLVMKLVPSDTSKNGRGGVDLTTFTPTLAYLTFDGVSTVGREFKSFRCDGGGVCAGYKIDALVQPFRRSITPGGSFGVSYQRIAGGLDVTTNIAVPAPGQPDWAAMTQFDQCKTELLRPLAGQN